MSVGARVDPYRNFNFLVEIDGITQAGFSDVTGFDITVEPIEYREGGQVTSARKIPGMAKYGNITLKRGITDSAELYEWLRQVATGVIAGLGVQGYLLALLALAERLNPTTEA